MTRNEAEKFARSCLYNYREDVARLEQKRLKLENLSSLKGVDYNNDAGKVSARYIDSVPWWLEEQEQIEKDIRDLRMRTEPVLRLIKDLEATKQNALIVYKTRYEQRMSWERARFEAREIYGVGFRAFETAVSDLINRTIRYLDLPLALEMYPEMYPKTYLENPKKDV